MGYWVAFYHSKIGTESAQNLRRRPGRGTPGILPPPNLVCTENPYRNTTMEVTNDRAPSCVQTKKSSIAVYAITQVCRAISDCHCAVVQPNRVIPFSLSYSVAVFLN
jgi:hypothetical protein